MTPETACTLVGGLVFRPGWTLEASVSDRFEDTIILRATYPAPLSNRAQARTTPAYTVEITPSAAFPILVGALDSDTGLYRAVLDVILAIEAHEARELLRVRATGWAPFHPHRLDGMARYGDVDGDLAFGVL